MRVTWDYDYQIFDRFEINIIGFLHGEIGYCLVLSRSNYTKIIICFILLYYLIYINNNNNFLNKIKL